MRADDRYEKMLEAYAVTKNFLRQQIDLGFDELYLARPLRKINAKKAQVSPASLTDLLNQVKNCKRCHLYKTRTNLVFGAGNDKSKVMFVGEAPGREEDLQGKPFVGKAGQLLDKILAAIDFRREEVYIANILKCRPPDNRDPLPDEIGMCEPYLLEQIRIIQPELICALGRIAAQALLKTKDPLSRLRGKIHDYHGTKFLVTYHPAALLRYPQYKRPTWDDVRMLKREYDNLS